MDKTIITAALTGNGTSKLKNPYLPVTPEEMAKDAYECYQAGAAIIHIHMRDETGMKPSVDVDRYRKTVDLIREKCDDVIVNLTTSGAPGSTFEERMAHLRAIKPEMASFNPGTFNWTASNRVYENPPVFLEELAKCMMENDVLPEMEIFDSGMIGNVEHLVKLGLINKKLRIQFVLGVLGGADATIETLVYLKSRMNFDATWSALGIGKAHLPIMFTTLAMGGDLRVGLEDNIYYAKGQLATNRMLVERAARVIREFGREPATPAEARKILGITR